MSTLRASLHIYPPLPLGPYLDLHSSPVVHTLAVDSPAAAHSTFPVAVGAVRSTVVEGRIGFDHRGQEDRSSYEKEVAGRGSQRHLVRVRESGQEGHMDRHRGGREAGSWAGVWNPGEVSVT